MQYLVMVSPFNMYYKSLMLYNILWITLWSNYVTSYNFFSVSIQSSITVNTSYNCAVVVTIQKRGDEYIYTSLINVIT